MKKLFYVLSLLILSGCASKTQLTREEQLALMERKVAAAQMDFSGVGRDVLIKAIENTLYLIDPKDVVFQHSRDRIIMNRSYMTILIFSNVVGVDTWIVNIKEKEQGKINVSIVMTGTQSAGMFISLHGGPINSEIKPEESWLSEAEMKLIFQRINYFLGRAEWISCSDAPKFAEENKLITGSIGRFPFVCGDNWHNVNPESPDFLKKGSLNK